MTKLQIADYFEQLNLSEIESKLYVTLLESGPITVRELAEAIEMKRTTAYLYIDQLVNKGLIMKVVKGARKLVAVVDPESSIERLITDKLTSAKALELQFPEIIKRIGEKLPRTSDIGDAEVKYYKGKNGVKKIYEEALSSSEVYSYVNLSDVEEYFPDNIISFDGALAKNKSLKLYEIVDLSPISKKIVEVLSQNKRYNFKFLPKDIKIRASDILIYEDNVAIINLRGNVTGVVFHNKDYFNISKVLFDHMWSTLPELK